MWLVFFLATMKLNYKKNKIYRLSSTNHEVFGVICLILNYQDSVDGVLNSMMSFYSLKTKLYQSVTALGVSILLFKSRTYSISQENY